MKNDNKHEKKNFIKLHGELILLLAVSIGIAFYLNWDKSRMGTVYTFLWMTSAIIGFGKIIKVLIVGKYPKKNNNVKVERTPTEKIMRVASKNFRVSGNALNPTQLGEDVAIITINMGGTMLDKIKSVSKTQWISYAITFLGLAFAVAVIYIPELAQFEEYILLALVTVFGSSATGTFKSGKDLVATSESKTKKCEIKGINKKLAKLDELYAVVIEAKANEDLKPLTAEQTAEYQTYLTNKAKLEAKLVELETVVTEEVAV